MEMVNLKVINSKEFDNWVFDNDEYLVISEKGAKAMCTVLSMKGEYLLLSEDEALYIMLSDMPKPVRATVDDVYAEVREIYNRELHRTEDKLRTLRGMEYNSYKKLYNDLVELGKELSLVENLLRCRNAKRGGRGNE